MTEQTNEQQPTSGQAAATTERRSARRVVKSTFGNAIGMGGCCALGFAIVALCAGSGKIAAGQPSGLSDQVIREAATGLLAGVILGAIFGAWKAMGWPGWGRAIVGFCAVGACLGASMGWRSRITVGTVVGAVIGALFGAALGGIVELDLGMRAIRTVGKVVRRRRGDQSGRQAHT